GEVFPTAFDGEPRVVMGGAQGAEESDVVVGAGSGREAACIGGVRMGQYVGAGGKHGERFVFRLHVERIGESAHAGPGDAAGERGSLADQVEDVGLDA